MAPLGKLLELEPVRCGGPASSMSLVDSFNDKLIALVQGVGQHGAVTKRSSSGVPNFRHLAP